MTVSASRICLLVLGMHRSGTSALTRVLSLMGAALPRNIVAADMSNEAGHWEPARLVALHEQMLSDVSSRWDDWRRFDPASLGAARLRYYRDGLRAALAEEFDGQPLFVVKDPRVCRFVPLFESILDDLGISTRHVLIHRNPAAVGASLQSRDQLTPGYGMLVWLRHVLDAEAATRGRLRTIVGYEDLLDNAGAVAATIADRLQFDWPVPWPDAAPTIARHLSRDLQHHRATRADLGQDSSIDRLVLETYDAILAVADRPDDASAFISLDAVRAGLDRGEPFLADALFQEMASRRRWAAENRSRLLRTEERLAASTRQLRAVMADLTSVKASRNALAAQNRRQAWELTDTIGRLQRRQGQAEYLRSRLQALEQSRSWRVTAPLRVLGSAAREVARRLSLARSASDSSSDSPSKSPDSD